MFDIIKGFIKWLLFGSPLDLPDLDLPDLNLSDWDGPYNPDIEDPLSQEEKNEIRKKLNKYLENDRNETLMLFLQVGMASRNLMSYMQFNGDWGFYIFDTIFLLYVLRWKGYDNPDLPDLDSMGAAEILYFLEITELSGVFKIGDLIELSELSEFNDYFLEAEFGDVLVAECGDSLFEDLLLESEYFNLLDLEIEKEKEAHEKIFEAVVCSSV